MAPATAPNTFIFNENQTVADILLVTATLERAGHRPQLRFVRWCDTPESIAVEFDPKEEKPRFDLTPIGRNALEESGEMGVAGVDELPDPALVRKAKDEDVRWNQVTADTLVLWEGEATTWGELSQNEKTMCEFYVDGTLVGGFSI